ncbi:HpcH/HpaI aldolase/citrate lyase family protein [Acidobacteriota bacterium]
MNLSFRQKLEQNKLCIGTFITLPCPEIAEICAMAGLDWILVDLEHTTLEVKDVQSILQAINQQCACIVRVPSKDEATIKRVLDVGVNGIMVPHVNTVEETTSLVQGCLYPPEGKRSVGIARAQNYGLGFKDYLARANKEIIVIPQVEHVEGVSRIDDIVRVPGVSGVFIGPYDLSGSMGMLGQVKSTEVQESIARVQRSCSQAGLPAGIFCPDIESARTQIDQGFTLIVLGMDSRFLVDSVRRVIDQLD